jgi:hypothetical protein
MKDQQAIREQQLSDIKRKKEQEKLLDIEADRSRKEKMKKEAEDDVVNQRNKITAYRDLCKRQFEENKVMKMAQKEKEDMINNKPTDGSDLMNKIFDRKVH